MQGIWDIDKVKNGEFIDCDGRYNIPYPFCEQIGKEIRDISDEIPFDIPESWEWVRFSNLVNFSMGKTPPRKEMEFWENSIYPWVSIADMPADGTVLSTKEKVNQYAVDNIFKSGISPIGTLIMSFKLTVGKVSILGIDAYHNEAIISIFPFVDDYKILTSYLFKILPLIAQNGDTKTAIKGATLNSDSLSNLLIPLPPISEQKRIVDKITRLEPCITSYDKAETQLTALNTTFPEALKKSILRDAVQGKLVPQDPNDEPASVLLERIRAEKQALIKAGKIKKDKHESVIVTRDKNPYEIPNSWVWIKLGFISTYNETKQKINAQNADKLQWLLELEDIEKGGRLLTKKTVSEKKAVGDKTIFNKGDILYSKLRPYLLKILVAPDDGICTPEIVPFTMYGNILAEYVVFYLQSPYVDGVVNSETYGVKMPRAGMETMVNLPIPLPPINEQHRIVAKINKLMPIINTISK